MRLLKFSGGLGARLWDTNGQKIDVSIKLGTHPHSSNEHRTFSVEPPPNLSSRAYERRKRQRLPVLVRLVPLFCLYQSFVRGILQPILCVSPAIHEYDNSTRWMLTNSLQLWGPGLAWHVGWDVVSIRGGISSERGCNSGKQKQQCNRGEHWKEASPAAKPVDRGNHFGSPINKTQQLSQAKAGNGQWKWIMNIFAQFY